MCANNQRKRPCRVGFDYEIRRSAADRLWQRGDRETSIRSWLRNVVEGDEVAQAICQEYSLAIMQG